MVDVKLYLVSARRMRGGRLLSRLCYSLAGKTAPFRLPGRLSLPRPSGVERPDDPLGDLDGGIGVGVDEDPGRNNFV